MPSPVDQFARDEVRDVRHELNNHVQTTELHLSGLEKSIESNHKAVTEKVEDIRKAILWAGGLVISIMLSVLGWAVLQQISANEAQKQELQQQIRLLQESDRARLLQQQNDELSARAAEAVGSSVGGGQLVDLGDGRAPDGRNN